MDDTKLYNLWYTEKHHKIHDDGENPNSCKMIMSKLLIKNSLKKNVILKQD